MFANTKNMFSSTMLILFEKNIKNIVCFFQKKYIFALDVETYIQIVNKNG